MTHAAIEIGREAPARASQFQVSDLVQTSTDEWPGRRAAVVVAQGCPWSCTYCHVPQLQDVALPGQLAWDTVMAHLRRGDGEAWSVVFSGGEPTRQLALVPAMREVRELGLSVGLHTAGAYPARLHDVLPHVDWVALDIKAMPEGYCDITTKPSSGSKAWESLDTAIAWGGPLEVRLTVDPTTHTREAVLSVIQRVRAMGGPTPVLQEARAAGTTEEFRAALAGRRLTDVLNPADLEGVTVRY